jgi:hypothetical protein
MGGRFYAIYVNPKPIREKLYMAYFPIINKHGRSPVASLHRQLPTFYMEDYSIIGFKVCDCDHAVRILDQHQFPLKYIEQGVEVRIDDPLHIKEVISLLKSQGLECEIADVADAMYQG